MGGSEIWQFISNYGEHTKFHVGLFSIDEMGSTI